MLEIQRHCRLTRGREANRHAHPKVRIELGPDVYGLLRRHLNIQQRSVLLRAEDVGIARAAARPQPAFPDLPPLATVARGFAVDIRVGVFAPAGTPAAIVERLNQEINAIAASPDLASVLEPDGTLPEAMSPAMFAGRIKDELGQSKHIATTEHKIVSERAQ